MSASTDVPAQVCGEFHDRIQLDSAMSKLEGSDFQRADLTLRVPGDHSPGTAGDVTPVTGDDAQNLRQLGTGLAAAVAALAAAGIVVATGGAALPAIAAAAAAGGGTAAAGAALGGAASAEGNTGAEQAATAAGVVLLVHAASPALRDKAEAVLRESGAHRVWVENG